MSWLGALAILGVLVCCVMCLGLGLLIGAFARDEQHAAERKGER